MRHIMKQLGPEPLQDITSSCSMSTPANTEPLVPLSPIPLPFLVDVVQGSPKVFIRPKKSSEYWIPPKNGVCDAIELKRGDRIRIYAPHISFDWVVSPDPTVPFNNNEFTLLRPYDHTRIIQIEEATKENEMMCQRLSRRSNNELPGSVFKQEKNKHNSYLNNIICTNDDRGEMGEEGLRLCAVRVWKLIPTSEDKRQAWKKQYDDGNVSLVSDFANSPHFLTMFNVQIRVSALEYFCEDVACDPQRSIHMQRVNYVTKVDSNKILREAFQLICHWHPVGKLVDHVKWAKFARKMNFLAGIKNSKHEVEMTFFRQSSKMEGRKLDFNGFITTIADISQVWYPHLQSKVSIASASYMLFFSYLY